MHSLLPSSILIYNLTMHQNFKIRKNTSLKEIKQPEDTQKLSKDTKSIQSISSKEQHKRQLLKLIHLQPLNTHNHPVFKRTELKFDYTQPVNIKGSSFSRQDSRYENAFLAPLEGKLEKKQKSLDKENRPASMNELKYFNAAKLKLTLEHTGKYETSKACGLKREINLEELRQIKHHENISHVQPKIVKSHSKTRLLKATQRDQRKQSQFQQKSEAKFQRTFRKGIIDQILQKTRTNQPKLQAVQINPFNDINSLPQTQSKISQDTYNNSPAAKKPLFQANCSTIKEKQQNTSSFLSKKGVEEFIQPIQQPAETSQERTQLERKRKMDFDKIKKKFPQNFFK